MAKINCYIIFSLISVIISKQVPIELQISFDYSNLGIDNPFINKLIKTECNKITQYFKNLLNYKKTNYLYKTIKKAKNKTIQCTNSDIKLNYSPVSINKTTALLIFPRINITENITHSNPTMIECLSQGTNKAIIILDFNYKSEKQMKLNLPINFNSYNYHWHIIRYILSSIGFNKNTFSKYKIINNILYNKITLSQRNSIFSSFNKFLLLTNSTKKSNQKEKFLDYWPTLMKLDDIMVANQHQERKFRSLHSMTELTLNALESLGFQVNPCELILYHNKCYKVDQKCLNEFHYEDYFLHYTLDHKNNRWICYYKTKDHFKKKQCSKDYGVLLFNKEINKNLLIDYLRNNDFQKIRLLKPAKTCPKPHPRTIFYSTVKDKEKEDPYQYKILDRVEEVTIKDPNYFVITNTFSKEYHVKSRAALYNNVIATSYKNWNFNYCWLINSKYDNIPGINLSNNKYQYIGIFPFDNTFKDGLNIFYNKQKAKFPEDYNYIPETYLYPSQKEKIYEKFKDYKYNENDVWLLKPARGLMAMGIKILNNYTDIKNYRSSSFLISRYIMNPLLINNKKFDMRAYILVTGMNPLKIYFYRDGYIKISVKDFTLDHKYIRDGCIHITTSDTNIECFEGKEYKYDTDIYDAKAHFWSYMHFERWCEKRGINYTDIMEQMKDIFVKIFISLNNNFIELMKKRKQLDRNLYQLYGLDLLVDVNNRVHLLELNRDPSMRDGHSVCDYMYDNLIPDILNIVGIVPFNHNETQETFDKDVYKYDDKVEEKVDDCLCEFGRPRGMFELVYPKKDNINKYKKFYEKIFPESQLLWDKLLNSNGEYD